MHEDALRHSRDHLNVRRQEAESSARVRSVYAPVSVGLLGADAVMLPPDNIADLVEQFGFAWGDRRG